MTATSVAAQIPPEAQPADAPGDPYIWLEDVEGERAMEWVEAQNARSAEALQAVPEYEALYADALEVITSDDRIAYPSIMGDWLYNFWTDEDNERGLWRRTSWESYLGGEPEWETVLDIDALGEAEGVNWAYKGSSCLAPDYERCLVRLSRGGADAVETREFDLTTKTFVASGFSLPESKGAVAWLSEDELLVATDFGEGSMTTSGYPRVVKRWQRGTPLAEAETVFEGEAEDVGSWASALKRGDEIIGAVAHRPSFFEGSLHVMHEGELVRLDLPLDADPGIVGDHMTLYLRSDWDAGGEAYTAGSLLAIDYDAFLGGSRDFQAVFVPTERQTVEGTSSTKNTFLVSLLDNVNGELRQFRFEGGEWVGRTVDAPDFGSVSVVSTSDDDDRFFFTYSSFLQPTTLYLASGDGTTREVTQLPAEFDASGLSVQQWEATSADGTRVPYFIVAPEALAMDGSNPTQLYGYGGFEVSLTPSYGGLLGKTWLERGGVYVLANIRGGGEFGPAWHRSAQRENRQRAFDDFIAVAEDLIARGVTSPEHLGIRGGSNGGLLTGTVMTQRSDLFNGVVISVPLLDMRRYHTLLAGASWMAEYGDPDNPEDWAFISQYSPYQNLREDADYPRPLFTTTTRDDRVHPGHARKMAAKMLAMGYDVDYVENTEGGHGSGVTPAQQATMWASIYSYLWRQLGG
ncbi:S9 family peptidase [Rubricoccus marinus]|uniref:S9 family peptidase n=2 Tax=Rubricoccus marinus TaxID=716817 RepID=A0A259U3C6_9BACT|nr:S9 family peptidase [Rubricoccus marinus]